MDSASGPRDCACAPICLLLKSFSQRVYICTDSVCACAPLCFITKMVSAFAGGSISVVGAVPVCPPARPARAHPSLGGAFRGWKHLVCTWKHAFRRWKRNICGWQHRIFGWKRRCADVSPCKGASIVQSPHIMRVFWYGNAATRTFGRAHRHRPYHFNTRRRSEKVKTKKLLLAVTLQALKREDIVPAPRDDDKTAKILFPRCTVTIKRQRYCSRAAR